MFICFYGIGVWQVFDCHEVPYKHESRALEQSFLVALLWQGARSKKQEEKKKKCSLLTPATMPVRAWQAGALVLQNS